MTATIITHQSEIGSSLVLVNNLATKEFSQSDSQDFTPILRPSRCGTWACPDCYAPLMKQRRRGIIAATNDWSAVAQVTLTVDQSKFMEELTIHQSWDEAALKALKVKDQIPDYVEKLLRAKAVSSKRWTYQTDFTANGFAHWHLLVEISSNTARVRKVLAEVAHAKWGQLKKARERGEGTACVNLACIPRKQAINYAFNTHPENSIPSWAIRTNANLHSSNRERGQRKRGPVHNPRPDVKRDGKRSATGSNSSIVCGDNYDVHLRGAALGLDFDPHFCRITKSQGLAIEQGHKKLRQTLIEHHPEHLDRYDELKQQAIEYEKLVAMGANGSFPELLIEAKEPSAPHK